jgi:hypothetical protein
MKIIIPLLILASLAFAQPPDTLWTRTYGGSYEDFGYGVAASDDGGYLLCGSLQSYIPWEDRDIFIVKINDAGDSIWTRTFGSTNTWEEARDITACIDGGYLLVGYIGLEDIETDAYLLKVDSLGNFEWERRYGGTECEEANAVMQTSDGGYIIVGLTYSYGMGLSDSYIIRTDEAGDTLWTKTYGGDLYEACYDVAAIDEGGFAIVSSNTSDGPGATGVEFRKLDENGESVLVRRYGGENLDSPRCLTRCIPSGYLIGGWTASFAQSREDMYALRVADNGDSLWMQTYGFADSSEIIKSAVQLEDGGFLFAGGTGSAGIGADLTSIYLVRTDSLGELLWSNVYGGFDQQLAEDVLVTSGNGLLVCGWTGDLVDEDDTDIYVMRFESVLDTEPSRSQPFPAQLTLRAFPNPFNSETTLSFNLNRPQMIELTLYNQLGQIVETLMQGQFSAGDFSYHLTASFLPSGTYYAQLNTPSSQFTRKLILVK